MTELALLLGLGLLAYYLWDSRGVDEYATQLARQACRQRQLQFLDFSVQKQKTRPQLANGGQPQWQRQYCFEFHVDGGVAEPQRYNARMTLVGRQVTRLEFDPHPLPDERVDYVEGPGQCMRR